MPVAVALPRARDRDLGIEFGGLLGSDRHVRPVVADLEEVDVADVAPLEGGARLVPLGVSGEKPRERLPLLVVRERELDGVLVVRPVDLGRRRDHPEREAPDANRVPVGQLLRGAARELENRALELGPLVVRRPLGHEHAVAADRPEEMGQAAHVVVVEVREDHGVEVVDVLPGQGLDDRVVGTGVHEDRGRPVRHEDGVPLADVEDAHPRGREEPPVPEHDEDDRDHAARQAGEKPAAHVRPRHEQGDRRHDRDRESRRRAHLDRDRGEGQGGERPHRPDEGTAHDVGAGERHPLHRGNGHETGRYRPDAHHEHEQRRCHHVGERGDERDARERRRGERKRDELCRERHDDHVAEVVSHLVEGARGAPGNPPRNPSHLGKTAHRIPPIAREEADSHHGEDGEQEAELTGERRFPERHGAGHGAHRRERVRPPSRGRGPGRDSEHRPGADGGCGRPAEEDEGPADRQEEERARARTHPHSLEQHAHDGAEHDEVPSRDRHQVRETAGGEHVVEAVGAYRRP